MIIAKFDFMNAMLYFHKAQVNKIFSTTVLLTGAFVCCAMNSFLTIVFIGALLIQHLLKLFIAIRLTNVQKIMKKYHIESDVVEIN